MRKNYQEIKDSPALSYISQMQNQEENEVLSNGEAVKPKESVDSPIEPLE